MTVTTTLELAVAVWLAALLLLSYGPRRLWHDARRTIRRIGGHR